MKQISLIINVVLALAIGVLYFLHFNQPKAPESVVQSLDSIRSMPEKLDGIAYINVDSVLAKYDYYTELNEAFEQKANRLQGEYNQRLQRLQNEFTTFQQTASTMSRAQQQVKYEELQQKEQNLLQYQQSLGQQLAVEEASLIDTLYVKVSGFLENYGRDNGLSIILTYTRGSGVWYADNSFDITREVIEGLNAAYREEEAITED